ncbi:MAG: DUF1858 domain-containing protein [Paludibacter sp.]|nr:DUF1858 domain-containing protein [Paludibacter sp.]
MNTELIITPKTKVLQLIETYPELEDLLINMVPAFEKLKNPVLRKTVAKIATLQQAAAIGHLKTEDLINTLRKAVGQELTDGAGDVQFVTVRPEWFDDAKITQEFDIREMLLAGEQPVNQVISDLNRLNSGEIYQLIAPFLPAPLIEKAGSLNIKHWVKQEKDDLFIIYFLR